MSASGEEPLAIVVGARYPVGERQYLLSERLARAVALCREALIEVAEHREVITYGELSDEIAGAVLPRHMGPLLSMIAHDCAARDEPSLASLVVSASTGEVSTPDARWAPPSRQACWDLWSSRSQGAGRARRGAAAAQAGEAASGASAGDAADDSAGGSARP
ncbi:hypothetical protein [Actinomyces marmotae]|uniref:Uncharacterized protein n=1 Tax=Actinomyces marmotae TaxID=2737173 RepID=A0A6M8AZZ8_9ACTO|nr:hypothetical protein [Actinomyces marmotae]QKD79548.1 hypothetical protein HPC72_04160 [Actinomyces marmotae]